MDAQLAQIYGTGVSAENDQVKLAAAELLVKLASDNQIDLSQFSDAEVAEMVGELSKTAEFPPAAAAEGKKESSESKESPESKEADEKVAEADFLGRVMAHSFNQELGEIQKQAGIKEHASKAYKAVGDFLKKQPTEISSGAHSLKNAITGKSMRAGKGGKEVAHKLTGSERLQALGLGAKRLAPAAGAAAAVGGGAYAIGKKKESSALDALASERAWELAKQAGWVDAEGNLMVPQEEKVASSLDQEVERRALAMLEAEGLPVQWNE